MQLGIILTPYGQIPGAYPSEIGYSYGGDGTYLCPDDPFFNTRGEQGFFHDTRLGAPPRRMGFFERMRARRVARALNGLGAIPHASCHPPGNCCPPNGCKQRSFGGLGHSIPSDAELGPTYGYVPHIDGWVSAREGFQPGSWIPPNGWNPAGAYGPQMSTRAYTYPGPLGGLRDVPSVSIPVPTVTADPVSQAAAQAAAAQIDATLQAHQDRMFKLTILSTTIVGLSALIATLRTWKQLKRDERIFNRHVQTT